MAKEKYLYNVYRTIEYNYNGLGEDSERTEFAGKTYAVSDKQAANNVAHRYGDRPFEMVELWGDGCKTTFYHAEAAT